MNATTSPGLKYDDEKLRVDLLPIRAIQEVAKVLTFGAKKYGPNNWQNVRPASRYFGAALRHLFARWLGERTDVESGLPHLAHAATCVLFMLSNEVGHDPIDALEMAPFLKDQKTPVDIGSKVRVLAGIFADKEGTIEDYEGRGQFPYKVAFENDFAWYGRGEFVVLPTPIWEEADPFRSGAV